MSLLFCKDLSIGYANKTVLSKLNFHVYSGDYLYRIGETGSGKSTLVKTLLSLVSPLSGEIGLSENLTKKDIGYLPQKNETQRDFPATVSEIVLSGCLNKRGLRPFYNKQEKFRAAQAMDKMNISRLKGRSFMQLSGGQQQRVLLARSLCAADKLLVLDEPVTGLDPQASAELYGFINKLNEDGLSIIMISHDINAAKEYASHILHLAEDAYFYGTKSEYFSGKHSFSFLKSEMAVSK